MAESQDFEIKIRVNADTAQVETIRQSFQRLGAQVQVTNVQAAQAAAATASAGAGNAAELGRIIGQFTGIGIGAAIFQLVSGLKQASAEIEKVAGELDKQGGELVKHAQLQIEAARHAKDQSDILKISDATLKDMESTQKTFNDLSSKELTWSEQVSDYLQVQLLARQKIAGVGDYEAAHQAEIQTALDQAMSARQRGMTEILAAEKALNQTTEEHLVILNREITAEERRKATATTNNDPGGYVKAANNLSKLKKEQAEFIALEEKERQVKEKQQEAAYGAASPQAKAILENEKRAREARAAGDEKSADQFQKTADQLRKSATSADLSAVQAVIDTYGKTPRPGRAAGVGESQEKVDEIERNRLRDEQIRKDEAQIPDLAETNKFIKQAGGKPITQAQDTSNKLQESVDELGRKFDRYWS